MSAQRAGPAGDLPESLLTIDALAAAVGLTVRTTRYYASLGLIPPPIRRGRVAYYDDTHRARLELVRSLQDHGFTLQAIEGFLGSLPAEATVEELALQRAMLTSWTPRPPEQLTHRQLEKKAGRRLSAEHIRRLITVGALERRDEGYVAMPNLMVGVGLLDVDVPEHSLGAAEESIRRHMESLADELTEILRSQVLEPYRREAHSPEDAARLEKTMATLRQLTLEAVVTGFQRAANAVITRSLAR
jgi:DNA-binding transcriptional MerR regulator